jgi:hypothetical protein
MKMRRFWPESAKRLLAQHFGKMITNIADEPMNRIWCSRWFGKCNYSALGIDWEAGTFYQFWCLHKL